MVKNEIINIIQNILEQLSKEGISIQQAYIYGSYARGEESKNSDIDLMLISEIFDNDDDKPIGKVWRISKSIDIRIEPYTVGLQRFQNDDSSPLLQIVKQEGYPIIPN
jgi:uncharacterized protein